MADRLQRELGVEARVVSGAVGEFRVLVADQVVAKKGWFRFPKDQVVVAAVRNALAAEPPEPA